MDPRSPGMHLFEVNAINGISAGEVTVQGNITDEVAIPPIYTQSIKNADPEVNQDIYIVFNSKL